jgi:hypothetical protein
MVSLPFILLTGAMGMAFLAEFFTDLTLLVGAWAGQAAEWITVVQPVPAFVERRPMHPEPTWSASDLWRNENWRD